MEAAGSHQGLGWVSGNSCSGEQSPQLRATLSWLLPALYQGSEACCRTDLLGRSVCHPEEGLLNQGRCLLAPALPRACMSQSMEQVLDLRPSENPPPTDVGLQGIPLAWPTVLLHPLKRPIARPGTSEGHGARCHHRWGCAQSPLAL